MKRADEVLDLLAKAKVLRYAELEPVDDGGPLPMADVKICDRGTFKLMTVFSLHAGETLASGIILEVPSQERVVLVFIRGDRSSVSPVK